MIKLKDKRIFVFVAIAFGLVFVWWQLRSEIEISNQQAEISQAQENRDQKKISPLSGLNCDNYQNRPMAVVLASDPVARPLAGISQADLVIELPVITGSITRTIAFFVCHEPTEIGSVRSARHDFIPLAMGFDAVLAHWGGSHFILDDLNNGIMDNIDALPNPFNAFYQKSWISQPHNGFTSMDRLMNAASRLGYRLKNSFVGYPHTEDKSRSQQNKVLSIGYARPYYVSYQYNADSNSYLRYRNNIAEIDKNNNQQVEAKTVVIMRAFSRQIEGPYYNDLDIEGTGECRVYQNGIVLDCAWQKDESDASKLYFLDDKGNEIAFVSGQLWIEIVEPSQEVGWE